MGRTTYPPKENKRIVFVILSGSYSHATGPLEYGKVLKSRGYDIGWAHLTGDQEWISDTDHGFDLIDIGPYPTDIDQGKIFSNLCQDSWTGLAHIKENLFDRLYLENYRNLAKKFDENLPDLFACDMFASSCVDYANSKNIPYVVMVDTGLGIFGTGELLDTPGFFTSFSHIWHQESYSLLKRLYNILFVTPQIIYYLGPSEAKLNHQRKLVGSPPQLTPIDKWFRHDIIFASHYGWDWARPLPPYYHLVGPVFRTGNSVPPLENDLQVWVQQNTNPIIYIAFGSRVTLTITQSELLLNSIINCNPNNNSNQKFRILWITKDNSTMPKYVKVQNNKVKNQFDKIPLSSISPDQIRFEKWISQIALLSDNQTNVALFISHAGISSIQEATHFGVPLLLTPFYGDQWVNVQKMQDTGASIGVDLKRFKYTEKQICDKINKLIYSPEIRKNVVRMQRLSHTLGSGGTRGADIIERAAVAGVEHLVPYKESAAVTHPIIAYNIDVFLCMAVLLYLLYLGIKYVYGAVFSSIRGIFFKKNNDEKKSL